MEGRGREGEVLVIAMEAEVAEESQGEGGLIPDGISELLLLRHCQRLLSSLLGYGIGLNRPPLDDDKYTETIDDDKYTEMNASVGRVGVKL
jgi:hypothetical protein